jgi:uncharacterized membrane protein YciS (DUF1049 family)
MDKTELLYDHYKDTCEIQRENIRIRNKMFVFTITAMAILLLLSYSPDTCGSAILAFSEHMYGINMAIQFGLIQCLAWVILTYFSMRYYQTTITIERTYKYIHKTENQLNKNVGNSTFIDREGKSYLLEYPICSKLMDKIYKWIFPLLYLVAICVKIFVERRFSLAYVLDVVLFILAFILCVFYMHFNYKIEKSYCNK